MTNLTLEQVRELMDYDPVSGLLFWRLRPVDMFKTKNQCRAWNDRYAGKEAFSSFDNNGYRQGAVFGRKYRAHRICWLLIHGAWPQAEIDHIDGDRGNNRADNLRDVPRTQNMRNKKRQKNSTSGVNGVHFNKANGRWVAYVQIEGRRKHLGSFAAQNEAVSARVAANRQYGFSENHGVRA